MSTVPPQSNTALAAVNALKELYDEWHIWGGAFKIEGAKEELLSRIKLLSSSERAILGVELDE